MESTPSYVASWPPPPPYFEEYTDDNVEAKQTPSPPPPLTGTFTMFGHTLTTEDHINSLTEEGQEQLYSESEAPTKELKKLNHSLLFNYFQLVSMLSTNSKHYSEKIEDIRLLFLNFYHMLNAYRPHQARDTLIQAMKMQAKQYQDGRDALQSAIKDLHRAISECSKDLTLSSSGGTKRKRSVDDDAGTLDDEGPIIVERESEALVHEIADHEGESSTSTHQPTALMSSLQHVYDNA